MAKRIFVIDLILIILIHACCFALVQDDSRVRAYKRFPAEFDLNEIEGEIVAIDAYCVVISEGGIRKQYKMAPQAKIFCNGLVASWQSLLPITPQAFFATHAVLNAQNQVVVLNGFYQGEECIICEWRLYKGGLCLRLASINDLQNKWRFVKNDARLPAERWLITGQVIYVLYSRDDQIRGVYLPD